MLPSELLADTIEATFLIGKNVINNAKVNGEITELERRRLHLMLSTGKEYLKMLQENKSK